MLRNGASKSKKDAPRRRVPELGLRKGRADLSGGRGGALSQRLVAGHGRAKNLASERLSRLPDLRRETLKSGQLLRYGVTSTEIHCLRDTLALMTDD